MGTWGHKVGADDAFCDVYEFFVDLYNQGASSEEASSRLQKEMSSYFSDSDDRYESYLALAFAQWETQHEDINVIGEVERFIATGESLENWSERGGDETLIGKRREALIAFLCKISKPRASRKRRVQRVPESKDLVLLDLIAPDGRKALTIQESYMDDVFLHTSGMVTWIDGAGSIFHSDRSQLEISASWLDWQRLEVKFLNAVEADLDFGVGNPNEAFFHGDCVNLAYEFQD